MKKFAIMCAAASTAMVLTACGDTDEDSEESSASIGEQVEYEIIGIDLVQ